MMWNKVSKLIKQKYIKIKLNNEYELYCIYTINMLIITLKFDISVGICTKKKETKPK